MPYATREPERIDHAWETKYRYAQSAKAHRRVMHQAKYNAATILLAAVMIILLVAAVAVTILALCTIPIG